MSIPSELKKLNQWVGYKASHGKIPLQPFQPFANAKTNDPKTWVTWPQVLDRLKSQDIDLPGFVFTDNDPYILIDLDKCVNGNGLITGSATGLIDRFNSYTEKSVSGTGAHIIIKVDSKEGFVTHREAGLEIYPRGIYCIMTGDVWEGHDEIKDGTAELKQLMSKLKPETQQQEPELEVKEGNRNNKLFSIAASLRRQGLEYEEIKETLLHVNKTKFLPPLEQWEVDKAASSAMRYKPQGTQKEKREAKEEKKTTDSDGCFIDRFGQIKRGIHNTLVLLKKAKNNWEFKYNVFSDVVFVNGHAWTDETTTMITKDIEMMAEGLWNREHVEHCLVVMAKDNSFNPPLDYLKSLKWDGKPRIEHIPQSIFKITPSEYHISVCKSFMVQAAARIMNPGCKANQVLLLIGKQGIGKSTFARELVPTHNWYSDFSTHTMQDKDGMMALQGSWIVEMSELSSMRRTSTLEAVNAFVTRQIDNYRPPYGRQVIERERRCVFVGTTNNNTPLQDPTGGRRYWIVNLDGNIDIEMLKITRDQLWAEAVALYKDGYPWYFCDENAIAAQAEATEADVFDELLEKGLPTEGQVTMVDCLTALKIEPTNADRSKQTRIGNAMKRLGWKHVTKTLWVDGKAQRKGYYTKPLD